MGEEPTREPEATVVLGDEDELERTVVADEGAQVRSTAAIPTRVGRYQVEGLLGSGGMGAVFRGWDPQLDRPVAVKLIHARRYPGRHDDDHARLVREAQALAALGHPNVVNVFEVGTHERSVFIAMELVEGPTLQGWVEEPERPWVEIVRMYVQAGRGLCAAHERGIVHRDFKPSNVIVGPDGRARVLDFGLATLDEQVSSTGGLDPDPSGSSPTLDALAPGLTRHSSVVGTPAYMAPEQHLRESITAAVDQFSFCVSLWGALTGVAPFPGRTLEEIRRSLFSGAHTELPPRLEVPTRVLDILRRGLRTDPGERWPSLAELLDRLEAAARSRRRMWPWLVGGAAVLAGALALALAERPPPRCDPTSEGTDPWDVAARESLRAVFEGSEVAEARDAWPGVARALDAHAESWAETYVEVCRGGVEAAGDQATFDLRMGCLRQQRSSFRAVLEVLQEASAEQLARAPDAVAQLGAARSCLEAAHGDPGRALPDDPEAAAAVSELRARLVGVEALVASGRREDALRQTTEVLELAHEVDFGPLTVEALLRHGASLSRLGRVQEAEPLLVRAFWDASDLDYPRVAAEAAIELAWQVGYLLGRHEEGIEWIRHFESMTRRRGRDPTINAAQVLGPIYFDAQRFDEARPYLELILEDALRSESGGHDVAIARMNLANLLMDMGELSRADEELRQAQELLDAEFPDGHPDLALTLINRANVLRLHWSDDAGAEALLRRGVAMSSEINGEEHPATGLGLMLLGELLADHGHYDEAIPLLERSRRAYREGSLSERLGAEGELAEALAGAGRTDEAEREWKRIEAVAIDELGPDHLVLARARAGLASLAEERGQIDEARRRYEEAIEGVDDVLPFESCALRLSLGEMLLDHDRADAGRRFIEQAHAWAERAHGPDHVLTVDAELAMAKALARTGEPTRARARLEALVARGSEAPMDAERLAEAEAELERLP